MKAVAAISFLNNHSVSMDVEDVLRIEMTEPLEVGDGTWVRTLIIRSVQGIVELNLTGTSRDGLELVAGLA